MKCKNCGKEIANDSVFCEYCGAKVAEEKKKNYKKSLIIAGIILAAILGIIGLLIVFLESTNTVDYVDVDEKVVLWEDMAGNEYIDLGLPSGILWKTQNEEGFYTYDEAVATFGNDLPTAEQLEELKEECDWEWTGNGYTVTGPNGNSITLPAAGYRRCDGGTYYVGSLGNYRSSTPNGSDKAWRLSFFSSSVRMDSYLRCPGLSVRLVQD